MNVYIVGVFDDLIEENRLQMCGMSSSKTGYHCFVTFLINHDTEKYNGNLNHFLLLCITACWMHLTSYSTGTTTLSMNYHRFPASKNSSTAHIHTHAHFAIKQAFMDNTYSSDVSGGMPRGIS